MFCAVKSMRFVVNVREISVLKNWFAHLLAQPVCEANINIWGANV